MNPEIRRKVRGEVPKSSKTTGKWILAAFLAGIMCLGAAENARSQGIRGQYYNPNDERFKFLALKKCEQYLREARSKHDRAKMLFEKKLISQQEFEKIEGDLLIAQVEYQQALLSVIFEKPHIVIERAIKYQTEGGQKRVKLTLRNSAGGAFDMYKLEASEADTLGYDMRPSELTNIYVCLKEAETIISHPYEIKIPVLRFGETKTIDFLLLKDLDTPVVSINYADKVEEKKILLQKGSSANVIGISSMQFSQEADFGSTVTYDLTLERFAAENKIFRLEVVNLPRRIACDFVDPKTDARLSQVKFTEGVTTRHLSLVLYLPDREDSTIAVDEPIEFFATAVNPGGSLKSTPGTERRLTESEIEKVSAGQVSLELIPRGRPKIELLAKELYREIRAGQKVRSEVVIRNTGTRRVDNLKVKVDLPYDWRAEISPEVIQSLKQDGEERVNLTLIPADNIGVGDYEIKIRTESVVDNRRVESEDRVVRIHIASSTRLIGSVFLVLLLTGLVVGIVVFGIKLSKR